MVEILSSITVARYTLILLINIAVLGKAKSAPMYYGAPLKVNAQLGVSDEPDGIKFSKGTKSISTSTSNVVYKPLSPLEKDLEGILDEYWSKPQMGSEYTNELPTKILAVKNNNFIKKDSFLNKHNMKTPEQDSMYDKNYGSKDRLDAKERNTSLDSDTRTFVNRSSILTKNNFSYYHPDHKKYYHISPSQSQVPSEFTIKTHEENIESGIRMKDNNKNSPVDPVHKNINKILETEATKYDVSSDFNTFQRPEIAYKPTSGPHNLVTISPSTTHTIKHSKPILSFGSHKPLFGHKPSVFESVNKKSGHRIPHKAHYGRPYSKLTTVRPKVSLQHQYYKPTKPPFHSNVSPNVSPSNNIFKPHLSSWNNDALTHPQYKPTKIPYSTLKTTYKPINFQTTNVPFHYLSSNLISNVIQDAGSNIGYKPTSSTSSIGLVTSKPIALNGLVRPEYKPTYKPFVESQQALLEVPPAVSNVVAPVIVTPEHVFVVTQAAETTTTTVNPNAIAINSFEDIDQLLLLVAEEIDGLYQNVFVPMFFEMENLLFGKSSDSPIRMITIFGLPLIAAALSAFGAGSFVIAGAAWLLPVISILIFPQLQ